MTDTALNPLAPPDDLDGYALDIWRIVADDMKSTGIFDWADRTMLKLYCELQADYVACGRQIDEDGGDLLPCKNGGTKLHPLVRKQHQLTGQLVRLGHNLGLTPLGREKLRAAKMRTPRLRLATKERIN